MNDALQHLNGAVLLVLPEVTLLAAVCVMFFVAPFLVSERGEAPAGLRHRWCGLSLIALTMAGWLWWNSGAVPRTTGPFVSDGLTLFVRGLTILSGAILVLLHWNQADDARSAESHACLLAILAGVNLVAAANDLVGLFVALELVSIPTYLFLLLPRRDAPAQEATLKYFLLSIFSSAIVLFGLSYLYGATGTTNLHAIHQAFDANQNLPHNPLVAVATVMLIAGLGFRLTAVPFHFYAPDVFQGAPTSAAAMLSFLPKVVGFVAVLRLIGPGTGTEATLPVWIMTPAATPLVWWLAVATMFVGNLMALMQTDIRRLLAFSSVSHAGYMLVGLVVGRQDSGPLSGIDALLFYLCVYGAMTLGTFAVLIAAARSDKRIESLDDLSGLSRTKPALALMLSVFLFSLAGLPPTAGFLAKFNLFIAAWSQGVESSRWLACLLGVNAALGAWYYLKMIGMMYLRDPVDRRPDTPRFEVPALVAAFLCLVLTIGLFFAPGALWNAIQTLVK
ncbi:MAG: NADH-quinone oxidoreductase subunit N [Planctomycetales bacterium]|nr:NADH-quinone oxidoreductase subunit N [Planctomycetales bacterium]